MYRKNARFWSGITTQWWTIALMIFLGAAPLHTLGQTLNLETNNLAVSSTPLNPYVQVLDGQWEGSTVASDGNCYFASSTHDNKHGAAFFRYNPITKVLTLLTNDLTRVCGEDPTVTPPQGKLHSDIIEVNGWLYFSTHLGNYWIEAETAYTGGHVIGYELATGQFRDFGVVRPNYTCYSGVGVDRVRNKILSYVTRWWGPTVDSHMYRIDIATGAKEDLGIVPGLNSFYFFVDSRGDCWFSCPSDNGSLRVVRSATGLIETYTNVLPEPQLGSARWWDWAKALPSGNKCVFHLQYGNFLYAFDADVFQTNAAAAITTIRNTGPADSGLALAPDRIYFIQRANRQPGNQEYMDFHLMSVPLFANTPIIDHGLIMDQNGRLVWRIPSMTADSQGRLFMVGDWWLLPGEQGTSVGTLRHVDDPGTNYVAVPRGEFFATSNFSNSPALIAPRRLLITAVGGGTVATDTPTNLLAGNAVVNITATASNGWRFLGWAGDADGTNPVSSIVMTRDKVLQAVFGTALTVSVSGNGSVVLNPAGRLYPYGTSVRMTGVPAAGYYFSQWTGSTNTSANPVEYIITGANPAVTARFNSLPTGTATVTVLINGRGKVTALPQANLYTVGEQVTFVAYPDFGQLFTGWDGDAVGTVNPLVMPIDGSKLITANFTARPALGIQNFPQTRTNSLLLSFTGQFGTTYRIDTSTNLENWSALGIVTNIFGTLQFTDPATGAANRRFYRAAVAQP